MHLYHVNLIAVTMMMMKYHWAGADPIQSTVTVTQ